MSKFFIIFIKGIVGLIWFVATVVTTVLLSPFMLFSWISSFLNKKERDNDEKASSEDQDN
ncbi:hypothetical protein [Dyadobacter sp. 3J3]|uniref:hypothetical protein n=1 Tax=Dyadobacter sp. 3J3 TaxID=2606600 RepID=UPI00135C4787|nr:hypothetical protein [Dyadobacter sp. 3J3]